MVDSEKAARMQAKVNQNPVWYYHFTYRGKQSLSDSMSGTTENYGKSIVKFVLEISTFVNRKILYFKETSFINIIFSLLFRGLPWR